MNVSDDNVDEYHELINGEDDNNNGVVFEGMVDYKGEKVIDRSKYGGWKSATFLIATQIAETFASFGVSSNLITYLTDGPLRQPTTTAAANVNAWMGTVWILPVFGAFVADSYLGRFRTVLVSCLLYIMGLGLLTLSVVLISISSKSIDNEENTSSSSSSFQVILLFSALYLIAFGEGGYLPCAQAFGADQFDGQNLEESQSKSSFFNWWLVALCIGSTMSSLILNYIQDNMSWTLGFGIPCIFMVIALTFFLFGIKTYRYSVKEEKENPFMEITRVFVAAARNRRATSTSLVVQEEAMGKFHSRHGCVKKFKFLDKALIDMSNEDSKGYLNDGGIPCTSTQVEEAKMILQLVPIWIVCLVYAIVFAQFSTFFTKQASTMDRSIGIHIEIPAASFQIFIYFSIVIFAVIYDRLLVPLAREITSQPNGITTLQRIGSGIFISTISMVVAAMVERRRIQIAEDFSLTDIANTTIPMGAWWLVPQYVLCGLAHFLILVGLQEFFYDQAPIRLRSLGLSMYTTMFGIGSFLSGFLIFLVEWLTTSGNGEHGWLLNNLNKSHLDYFYWLLGGLSLVEFLAFLYVSKSYCYKQNVC